MFFWAIPTANPKKKVYKPRFWRDPLLGYGRGSSYCVGGRRRGQICLHFLILSSFPHFVFISSFCLALLALVSNFFIIMCACNPHHRFWIPLAVTLTWWAVIFLSAGNYRSSHCYLKLSKILLQSKLSNILIYFQYSSSGRPGSGLHSTLCYLQVTKAFLAIY